jgi:hypothetical protein
MIYFDPFQICCLERVLEKAEPRERKVGCFIPQGMHFMGHIYWRLERVTEKLQPRGPHWWHPLFVSIHEAGAQAGRWVAVLPVHPSQCGSLISVLRASKWHLGVEIPLSSGLGWVCRPLALSIVTTCQVNLHNYFLLR